MQISGESMRGRECYILLPTFKTQNSRKLKKTSIRLNRCRSKYYDLEWRFNELRKVLYGVFESHRLDDFINERDIK